MLNINIKEIFQLIGFFSNGRIDYIVIFTIFIMFFSVISLAFYLLKLVFKKIIQNYFIQKGKYTNQELLLWIEKSQKIQETLQKISLKVNATTVFLMQFHNTTNSINGVPFIYQSCTHWFSKTHRGDVMIYSRMNNVLLSFFPKFIKQLIKNRDMYICNLEQWPQNSMKQYLQTKFKSAYIIALDDENSNLMGYITIGFNQYCNELTLQDEKYIEQMKNCIKYELKKMRIHDKYIKKSKKNFLKNCNNHQEDETI